MPNFLTYRRRPRSRARVPETHDYRRRYWGHDYSFRPLDDDGLRATANGWGMGLRDGDYLLLVNRGDPHGTRYRIESVSYGRDPKDIWFAELVFSPRTPEEKEADGVPTSIFDEIIITR